MVCGSLRYITTGGNCCGKNHREYVDSDCKHWLGIQHTGRIKAASETFV